MNPYILEKMLEERHRDMLIEAKRLRLIAVWEENNRARKAKILAGLGEILVKTGEKLQRRYGNNQEVTAG